MSQKEIRHEKIFIDGAFRSRAFGRQCNPGFYYLGGNFTLSNESDGIIVNADHVTIDLMGFTLAGGGFGVTIGYGVSLKKRNNVEIRNGTLTNLEGFHYAVHTFNLLKSLRRKDSGKLYTIPGDLLKSFMA